MEKLTYDALTDKLVNSPIYIKEFEFTLADMKEVFPLPKECFDEFVPIYLMDGLNSRLIKPSNGVQVEKKSIKNWRVKLEQNRFPDNVIIKKEEANN